MDAQCAGAFVEVIPAVLRDTCEVPGDDEENSCIIFDNYNPGDKEFWIGARRHHLLLCLEIFRSEMEFARKNGSAALFKLLKHKNHYPYSDMDRKSVV